MVKQKSSATSATRKKHAKKAAGGTQATPDPNLPKEKKPKGKDKAKGNKKEPRQKVYIPPSKPAPIQPDPLDTMGLARTLPPELVVVLRKFGKRDGVTKKRALEELQAGWIDPVKKQDGEAGEEVLVNILPVWVCFSCYPRTHEYTSFTYIIAPSCPCIILTPLKTNPPSYSSPSAISPTCPYGPRANLLFYKRDSLGRTIFVYLG